MLPKAVLFACSRNAVRSPMAAAFMQRDYGISVYVVSAGLFSGERDSFTEEVLREAGLALDEHGPRTLEDLHDISFDLIVALSPEAHDHILALTKTCDVAVEFWPTPDPAMGACGEGSREQRLGAYRQLRDFLARRVRERFGPPGDIAPS
jgi:protein-tyrosine-phosphatase